MFTLIPETHINFMGKRRIFYIVSAAVTLIGIVAYILQGGFKYGIDFAGGRLIEIRTSQTLPVEQVRAAAADVGFAAAEIQRSGQGDVFLIRIPEVSDQKGGAASPSAVIRERLTAANPGLSIELLRALLDVLEREGAALKLDDLRSTLAAMQMNYARAVAADAEAGGEPAGEGAAELVREGGAEPVDEGDAEAAGEGGAGPAAGGPEPPA